jgi:hypothetical protein
MSLRYSPLEPSGKLVEFFSGELMIQDIEFSIHLGPVGVHPGLDSNRISHNLGNLDFAHRR